MIVTGVQKRRGRQVLLVIDDAPGPVIDAATFEESPYRVGSFLSYEDLAALEESSRQNRAREKALFLLSLRDYSKKELETKLCREKGRYVPGREEAAATAAQRMEDLGFVNDRSYAFRLARDMQERKGYPRRRAVQELQHKGISGDLAAEAVEAVDADDAQLALALLRKKYYNKMVSGDDRKKTAAALGRFGFSFEDIRRAMSLWDEEMD